MAVLEGLNEVDWDQLEGSSGKRLATNVPTYLKQLLDEDPKVREDAYYSLGHPLGMYDLNFSAVTLVTLPFLLKILAYDKTPEKHYIVSILEELPLAAYSRHHDRHANTLEFQIAKAVIEGLPIYLEVLNDKDFRTRLHTVSFLFFSQWDYPKKQRSEILEALYRFKEQETHPEILAEMKQCFLDKKPEDWPEFPVAPKPDYLLDDWLTE